MYRFFFISLVPVFVFSGCSHNTSTVNQASTQPVQMQEEVSGNQEIEAEPEPKIEQTDNTPTIDPSTPSEQADQNDEPVETTPTIKSFDVTAKQWEFIPATIRVQQGDTVQLKVTSIDVTHGLTISAFGIKENLEPNQTVTVEFVADKVGTFSMICSVFCGEGHAEMRGSIIVE